MRYFPVFLLACLLPTSANALELKFRTGEVQGVFDFVKAIDGGNRRSRKLRELYEASPAAEEASARGYLRDWRSLDQNFSQWENFFETQSILARDVADFDSRTTGILPIGDQARLRAILTHFLPVYRRLVRNAAAPRLGKLAEELARSARKPAYRRFIAQIPAFYRSDLPERTEFTVGLVPVPGEEPLTFASSLGAVEAVGVGTEHFDIPGTLGVIAHELCHSFSTVGDLGKYFRDSGDPSAAAAYRNLEEALATAVGNGYGYRLVKGALDKGAWYNNPVLDAYARALYPNVVTYFEKKRTLDEAFAQMALKSFKEHVGELAETYDSYLDTILLVSGNVDRFTLSRTFRDTFPMKSIFHAQPLGGGEWKKLADENWMASLVLVVGKGDAAGFGAMVEALPELRPIAKDLIASGASFWEGRLGERAVFIFRTQADGDLGALAKKVRARGRPDFAPGIRKVF